MNSRSHCNRDRDLTEAFLGACNRSHFSCMSLIYCIMPSFYLGSGWNALGETAFYLDLFFMFVNPTFVRLFYFYAYT
jgi:hypothetical protein